jgi:hypothetical protein
MMCVQALLRTDMMTLHVAHLTLASAYSHLHPNDVALAVGKALVLPLLAYTGFGFGTPPWDC